MTGLFPEPDPPAPTPVPTTAPLFDTAPVIASARRVDYGTAVLPQHQPRGDVALFDTVLSLPAETGPAGPLAFGFELG